MSFAFQPPEITSGEMYMGPGAGPLLAAAAAWDALAAELQSTASSYGAIVDGLVNDAWTGPSSVAMAAAAAPFVTWMTATSAQAKTAAVQAMAAVSAYETTFAAVVPPTEIATNRAELAMLLVTNTFGQNTAAIAATEGEYGEMWAQDAAAMFSYANASAAATRLTPFTEPPQTTDATGLARQAAAAGEADAAAVAADALPSAAAASSPYDFISQLLEALGNGARNYMNFWDQVLNGLTGSPVAGATWQNTFGILADIGRFSTVANDSMSPINLGMTEFKLFWKPPVEGLDIPKSALGAGLGMRPAAAVGFTSPVSAGVGEANVVGRLSVPPTWASATPAIRMVSTALPAAGLAAAPASGIPGSLFGPMALGSLTGGALGAASPQIFGGGARVRASGGKCGEPVKLDDVIAKLQKEPEAVQHWNVDKAGLDALLDQLSKKPGIHTVHVSRGETPKVTLPDVQLPST
ncbi:PPE family protein [Mycobacterium montefiorense]|uniref:PPE family protein n=2 Tax=Mycobacterium montefiorense TaxID=154654 RepID=UPI0021F30301|nr:PPE family protein [Mycobacterium montefiorense]MCV7425826.1 PPE family protein [Mycobacterium montefiorense]